jgi:hypothetical protein
LSKVKVRTGAVTHGHGLAELALRPKAVENNTVNGDDEDFDDNFNDAAYKCPVLVIG